jgi:hypothetical protein
MVTHAAQGRAGGLGGRALLARSRPSRGGGAQKAHAMTKCCIREVWMPDSALVAGLRVLVGAQGAGADRLDELFHHAHRGSMSSQSLLAMSVS